MSCASPNTAPYIPQIRLYQNWLRETRGLSFADYDALWRWSTSDLDAFWQSIWDYFDLQSPTAHSAVLASNTMPGAQWFPGAQVNYVQQVLRHVQPAHAAGMPAVISRNEQGLQRELSWPELQRQVASLALHLRAQGVAKGDRVAAYLPNIPEAMVAFLACASLGAIWSICAPDMGTHAVLDRFKQIAPKALIAVDGVHYAGKDIDRREVLQELRQGLPSVQHVVLVPNLNTSIKIADTADYTSVTARNDADTAAFEPEWLAFDHPLWIVYSSGTTGLPKPIVHGHGGMVLVALQLKGLHNDIGCSYEPNSWGERYHWYSSTGWVMWNAQVSGLLGGTTCVIFDGSPGGSKDKPDWGTLWRFAAETGVTSFGSGAAFYANCMKAGVDLSACGDLSRIRGLGSTGSPLSAEVQQWGTDQFRKIRQMSGAGPSAPLGERGGDIWWNNLSGGTDFAGAFIGGNRDLPLVPGVMQCRQLGAAVEAWNEEGQPVMDEVGELVCTQPIPSMPLFLWGDVSTAESPQGAKAPSGGARLRGSDLHPVGERGGDPFGKRYLSSYFDMYPAGHGRQPGGGDGPAEMGPVWRHGDWIKLLSEGGCIIYGRSDATINRHGLRMGTSEIYSAVEALPEVLDSMVVDLEYLGKDSYMPLFVALRPGVELDAALRERINKAIRSALSPRFVPDDIFAVAEIPRTLSGKKQELPIKKLLLGQPLAKVVNKDAMANPGCLDWYEGFAREYLAKAETVA
ncbi:acetoacetate--CoA ligase [Comamonas testosteroni]|uniref:Acetoacetyl-CoA synthase n=1 Tax=Comamonas testosteroni (strain DSM 14576 / KF-1) TaxID=399795 RepID=B7X157_COMTK|nr:acetoacetate--CoA ligase [Comamonas testosteroni]EED70067.1 acetoacetyl-CoA synthase [Comamonas testosteroni KF-1]WQG68001.1 acetoacetate--CoA ligase [Comamonas testosteroni]